MVQNTLDVFAVAYNDDQGENNEGEKHRSCPNGKEGVTRNRHCRKNAGEGDDLGEVENQQKGQQGQEEHQRAVPGKNEQAKQKAVHGGHGFAAPEFGKKSISAAERGTATHEFLQFCDFANAERTSYCV